MIHYTLNTGHSRVSPRSEVSDAAIAAVGPLLSEGRHAMPGPLRAYQVQTSLAGTGMLASVYSPDGRPCVTFAVAPDADAAPNLWPAIESLYLRITEGPVLRRADFAAPRQPATTPWCAAVTILATPDEAYWLADFERVVAWAQIARMPTY